MANKKARYRTKNANGSYDVNWFETCGEQVLFNDGTTAETNKTKWDSIIGVTDLSHSKVATTHKLDGLSGKTGMIPCQFKAEAAFSAGDTFTVDGASYAVKLTNGEAAEDNLFVSGAAVSCIVDTAGKTVNFKAGGGGYKKGDVLAPESLEAIYQSPSESNYAVMMIGRPTGINSDGLSIAKAVSSSLVVGITNYSPFTLKVIDFQKAAVTCSLSLRSGSITNYPLTVSDDKKTVYTLYGGYVQKHDISANKTVWTKKISTIESGGTEHYGDIAYYKGNIYVLCDIKKGLWDDSHTFELSAIDENGNVVKKGTFQTTNDTYGNDVKMHIYQDKIGVLEKTGNIHYLNLQCVEVSSAAITGIDSNYQTVFYKDTILSLSAYNGYLKKHSFGGDGSEIASAYNASMQNISGVWDDVVTVAYDDSSGGGGLQNYTMSALAESGNIYANSIRLGETYGYGVCAVSNNIHDNSKPFLCRLTGGLTEYRITK